MSKKLDSYNGYSKSKGEKDPNKQTNPGSHLSVGIDMNRLRALVPSGEFAAIADSGIFNEFEKSSEIDTYNGLAPAESFAQSWEQEDTPSNLSTIQQPFISEKLHGGSPESSNIFNATLEQRLSEIYYFYDGLLTRSMLNELNIELLELWASLSHQEYNQEFYSDNYELIDDIVQKSIPSEGLVLLERYISINELNSFAIEWCVNNPTKTNSPSVIQKILKNLQLTAPDILVNLQGHKKNFWPAINEHIRIFLIRNNFIQPTEFYEFTADGEIPTLSSLSQLEHKQVELLRKYQIDSLIEDQAKAFESANVQPDAKTDIAVRIINQLIDEETPQSIRSELVDVFLTICQVFEVKPRRLPSSLIKGKEGPSSIPSSLAPNFREIIDGSPDLKGIENKINSFLPTGINFDSIRVINSFNATTTKELAEGVLHDVLDQLTIEITLDFKLQIQVLVDTSFGLIPPSNALTTPDVQAVPADLSSPENITPPPAESAETLPPLTVPDTESIRQAISDQEIQALLSESENDDIEVADTEIAEPEFSQNPQKKTIEFRTKSAANSYATLESYKDTSNSFFQQLERAFVSQETANWQRIFIQGLSEIFYQTGIEDADKPRYIEALNEIINFEATKQNIELSDESIDAICSAKESSQAIVESADLINDLFQYLADFEDQAKSSEINNICLVAVKKSLSNPNFASMTTEQKANLILKESMIAFSYALANSDFPADLDIVSVAEEIQNNPNAIIDQAKQELQTNSSPILTALRENKLFVATSALLSLVIGTIGANYSFNSNSQKSAAQVTQLKNTPQKPSVAPKSVAPKKDLATQKKTVSPEKSPSTETSNETSKKQIWEQFLSKEDKKIQLAFEGKVILDVAGEGLHQRIDEAKDLFVKAIGKDVKHPDFQSALANYTQVKREIQIAWHQKYKLSSQKGELPVVKSSFDPTHSNAYVDASKEIASINAAAVSDGEDSGFVAENNYTKDQITFIEHGNKKAKKGLAGAFLKLRDTFKKIKSNKLFAKLRPAQPTKQKGANNTTPNLDAAPQVQYASLDTNLDTNNADLPTSPQDFSNYWPEVEASTDPAPRAWFDRPEWPAVEPANEAANMPAKALWNPEKDVFTQEYERSQNAISRNPAQELIRTGKYESTVAIVEGFGGRKSTMERLLLNEAQTPEQALAIQDVFQNSIRIKDIESDEFNDGSILLQITNSQALAELDIIINQNTARATKNA